MTESRGTFFNTIPETLCNNMEQVGADTWTAVRQASSGPSERRDSFLNIIHETLGPLLPDAKDPMPEVIFRPVFDDT
jgi:hypothetical protein